MNTGAPYLHNFNGNPSLALESNLPIFLLEEKLVEACDLILLTTEYDSFVNIHYSTQVTKTVLQVEELIEQIQKKISNSRKEPKPMAEVEPRMLPRTNVSLFQENTV